MQTYAVGIAVVSLFASVAFAGPTTQQTQELLKGQLKPSHPRLYWGAGTEKAVRERIAQSDEMKAVHELLIRTADRMLPKPPAERVMEGRRLLRVSRNVMDRVVHLSYAFRMTGDRKYFDRARAEMLAVAAFSDWNPSHFLDVGEMTAAMGIGYDWLFNELSEQDRTVIRAAIVSKGLREGFKGDLWWRSGTNNWNQVCNGGLTVGALAVAEDEPVIAAEVISAAAANVPLALKSYEPDGAYPEGPGYWEYGTTYNVLMLDALETALGTDLGLASAPGFLKTADYFLHVTAPSGNWCNYADCGRRAEGFVSAAQFYFARKAGRAELLYNELEQIRKSIAKGPLRTSDDSSRFTPFVVLWAPDRVNVAPPATTHFVGGGPNPVALFRSGWDPEASFLAFKAGSPSVSHGHMDVGSFIFESQGLRWVEDLGMQDYQSLESKKVDLWNIKQDSQRWMVYRVGSFSHNIITVDQQQQRVAGKARFTRSSDHFAVTDLASLYSGQLAAYQRGVKFSGTSARVQDELKTLGKGTAIRWAFATRATLAAVEGNTAVLELKGKKLRVTARGADVQWVSAPAKGDQDYDAENPGVSIVSFSVRLTPGQQLKLAVDFGDEGGEPTDMSSW